MSDIDSDTDNMLYKCDNRPKCKREVILYDRFDCYYCYREVCRRCADKENWIMCAVCERTVCRKCMTEMKRRKYCPEPDCNSFKDKTLPYHIG
jgi:hypothetical protein